MTNKQLITKVKENIENLIKQAMNFQKEKSPNDDMFHFYSGAISYLLDALRKCLEIENETEKKEN